MIRSSRRNYCWTTKAAYIGILITFSISIPVHAVPISIDIQARITTIQDYDGYLLGAIGVGDIMTGTYIYETETPDSNTNPNVGDYQHATSPYGVTINTNDYAFRTDPDNHEVPWRVVLF
jgi:hypothetical protein